MRLVFAALPLILAGCAATPLQTDDGVEPRDITAAELSDPAAQGEPQQGTVVWGGVILGVAPLADTTQIEVLAYPLNRIQRPMTGRATQGRFLIVQPGFLEPLDFQTGRQISVLGQLDGSSDASVGEATRKLPRVLAEQLHLWRPGDDVQQPRFSIGIGIGL